MNLSKLSINIQYLIVFLLGVLIFVLYGSNVKNIYTVWQIGDEAGYLMNAAFFSGHDWSGIYEVIPYYGYGYSLLLIPFFLLFGSGIEIIKGAIFVNILCIVITYFIQIVVMKIITKDNRLSILAFISFVICFYPYLVGETYQVIAEALLVLLFWISILLLSIAVRKQSTYFYILYGLCIAYMFFVHARTILVVIAAFITVLFCMICKHVKVKHMISFVCAFVVFFIIGYFIKKYIIQSIYTGITVDGELKDRNIITIGYIFDRLKWLFNLKNIKLYVYSFFAKVFYLLVSTATMIIIGLISIVKKFKKISKLNSEQTAFTIFIFLSFILMFFACCINGTGSSENFAYSFYARYFEYTISPIVFIGVYTCLYYRLRMKDIFFTILVCLISGIMTSNIITNLDSNEIHVDVYRIAGFSYGIKKNDNFESLIFYLVILIIFVFVLIFIFNYILKIRTVILLFILIYFFNSNLVCIDTINTINQNSILDLQIAEYITGKIMIWYIL